MVSISTFHSNLDCSSPRQENKFEYKDWKVNLLVISVITNYKKRLAVRYRSEYSGDLRYQRISLLTVLEFSVKATYLFALIRHKWQNSLYKEHASDLKYYQWLERGAHVACHGLSGGRFLRRPGVGGGVMGGWLILEKIYTCTLYTLEVHIGKKRILHNSSVQKTFTYVQWAEKQSCSRCSLGWQYELHFPIVMIKRFCICTCVPAKKDPQHKDLFLSNGFFFKFTTPVVTILGQTTGWVGYSPTNNSIVFCFVLHILW